jgi:hypothetical protein
VIVITIIIIKKQVLYLETVESEFNSIYLIEVVVYSELHRTSGVIVFLRVPTAYLAALVWSVLIASSPRVCALLLDIKKQFGTRGSKVKNECRIQDGGRPGAGILSILDE